MEVKGNVELKRPLAKAASRLPLSGRRLKRGPDQMEEALEPEKVSWVWRSMDVCVKPSRMELWTPPNPCLSPEKNTRPGHQSDHDPPPEQQPSAPRHRHKARPQVGYRAGETAGPQLS